MNKRISADMYRKMPWKNGQGVTWELARKNLPGSEDFIWRISIAAVAEDGPFSLYAGYHRIISTLEGNGMLLEVDGTSSQAVGRFALFPFSGESAVHCTLTKGAIRDFNVIYRPDICRVRVEWLHLEEVRHSITCSGTTLVYAVDPCLISIDGEDCLLEAGDSYLAANTQGHAQCWAFRPQKGTATCCCVAVDEASAWHPATLS